MNASHLVRFAALVVGSFVTLSASTSQAVLVNHWMFDESNGQPAPQVLDLVGSNNGTFQNGITDANRSSDIPAKVGIGRSLDFNAGSDYVSLNSQIALPSSTNWSIALWYKGTDTTMNSEWGHALLGRNSNDIWANLVLRSGKAEFIHFNGGWQHNIASTTTVANGQWHHIALVNHSNQTADLYIDGLAEIVGQSSSSGVAYRIDGMMAGYSFEYTLGLLDDARIYNHALTQAEITELAVLPVPEPLTFVLLGAGASLLAFHRKARRTSK